MSKQEDHDSDDVEDLDLYEDDYLSVQSIRDSHSDVEESVVVTWKMGRRENTEMVHTAVTPVSREGEDSQTVCDPRVIRISTVLEPENIAPLFSGAEWAGTRVWHAAIRATEYLYDTYGDVFNSHCDTKNIGKKSLVELGCGLGVPGMIASKFMGASPVVLTDQSNITSQLIRNVKSNFPENCEADHIAVLPLDWSRKAVRSLLKETGLEKVGFDFVLNCDCVFEPLYGKSWMLLIEVIDEFLLINPKCIVLTSMERRNSDGINLFLEKLRQVGDVDLVHEDIENNIEIYSTTRINQTE